MTSLLIWFMDDSISSLGIMSLHIIFDDEPYSKIVMTKFIVVNIPSAYNVIIGLLTLNWLRVVVLIYHMVMKFPTKTDVRKLRSNPKESC